MSKKSKKNGGSKKNKKEISYNDSQQSIQEKEQLHFEIVVEEEPSQNINYGKIKKFIDEAAEKKISSEALLLPPSLGLIGFGVGGAPFYPAGLEYTDDDFKYVLATAGFISNGFLYWELLASIVEDIIFYAEGKPTELVNLINRQLSYFIILIGSAVILECASASILPFIGLAEDTNAPLWNLVFNIVSNLVAHIIAFKLALSENNFMNYKHVFEVVKYGYLRAFSSEDACCDYKDNLMKEHTLNALYEYNFEHFGNVLRRYLADPKWSEDYFSISKQPIGLLQKIIGDGVGVGLVSTSLYILYGYMVAAFNAAEKYSDHKQAIALPLTVTSLFFFLYLVVKFTFPAGRNYTDFIVDVSKNIYNHGFKEGLDKANLPSWFKQNKKLVLLLASLPFTSAFLSFASTVLLDKKGSDGIKILYLPATYLTFAMGGIFNVSPIPDLLRRIAEFVTLYERSESKILAYFRRNDSEPLLKQSYEFEATSDLKKEVEYDYKFKDIMKQLQRLPEDTFLDFFNTLLDEQVKEPSKKDEIVKKTTEGKLENRSAFHMVRFFKIDIPKYFGRNSDCVDKETGTKNSYRQLN